MRRLRLRAAGSNPPPLTTAVALGLLACAVLFSAEDQVDRLVKPTAAARGVKVEAKPGAGLPAGLRGAVSRLSVEEQVAQLFLVPVAGGSPGREWGGVLVAGEAAPAAVRVAVRRARPVAPLVASTALPAQPGMRSREARGAYRAAGRRLRSGGVGLAVGLSADVTATAAPMAERAFGDDPAVVAGAARSAVAGLASARLGVAVGHFPGQGGVGQDPIDGPASVGLSRPALAERDLVPFRAVAARADAITVSSAIFPAYGPATPASLTPEVIRAELRERLGFKGVAVTDDLTGVMAATGGDAGSTAVAALRAGMDLVRVGDERQAEAGRRAVVAALRSGRLPVARVDEALGRVLALKQRLGLVRAG